MTAREILETHVRLLRQLRPGQLYSIEDFVLQHGREYKPTPRPIGVPRGWPKQCFANCLRIIARRKRLLYVEGYAVLKVMPLPIHHAWLAAEGSDDAIDPTTDGIAAYFGVAFDTGYVRQHWRRTQKTDNICLLDRWAEGWPLLRMTTEQLQGIIVRENQCQPLQV